jgi:hypothetical protein
VQNERARPREPGRRARAAKAHIKCLSVDNLFHLVAIDGEVTGYAPMVWHCVLMRSMRSSNEPTIAKLGHAPTNVACRKSFYGVLAGQRSPGASGTSPARFLASELGVSFATVTPAWVRPVRLGEPGAGARPGGGGWGPTAARPGGRVAARSARGPSAWHPGSAAAGRPTARR